MPLPCVSPPAPPAFGPAPQGRHRTIQPTGVRCLRGQGYRQDSEPYAAERHWLESRSPAALHCDARRSGALPAPHDAPGSPPLGSSTAPGIRWLLTSAWCAASIWRPPCVLPPAPAPFGSVCVHVLLSLSSLFLCSKGACYICTIGASLPRQYVARR